MKFEARNAKLETNSNHRSKNFKHGRKGGWTISSFGFWTCFGFRYSNFEFTKDPHQKPCGLPPNQTISRNHSLNFSFSRASIFSNRLLCLPSAKGVSSQTFTISFANSFPTIRPPIIKILASLCSRLQREE
jgi:hypothetical protein